MRPGRRARERSSPASSLKAGGLPRLPGSADSRGGPKAEARRRRKVRRGQGAAGFQELVAIPGAAGLSGLGVGAPLRPRGRAPSPRTPGPLAPADLPSPRQTPQLTGLDSARVRDNLCLRLLLLTVSESLFIPTQPLTSNF